MSKFVLFRQFGIGLRVISFVVCYLFAACFGLGVVAQTSGVSTRYDFDGDRKADESIFRPSTGAWWYRRSSDGTFSVSNFGIATDRLAAADYDGDGKTDFAVYRAGIWYCLKSLSSTVEVRVFGLPTDVPVPSDFDGDGKGDIAIFRPSNGTWHRMNSGNGQYVVNQWGLNGDIPVAGDYDADGKTDISLFRPADGTWYRINSLDSSTSAGRFGTNGDIPLAGDFDGDGKSDLAVWRPSNASWYILRSSNGSVTTMHFGLAADVPVPADYDGDRIADIAVFRPSNSVWYSIKSTTGVFEAFQFGLNTDVPIPSQNNTSPTPTPNRAPVANNDSYSATEDVALTTPASGVLSNDTDADGNALTAVLVAGPIASQGTVILNANGSFVFTPAPNFNGSATFSYRASDGTLTSGIATVTINVAAINDAPVAVNDTFSSTGGTLTTSIPGILSNDSDIEGNSLTAVLVAGPTAAQGTLTLNANGSFVFTPALGFSGAATFTYRASDGFLTSNVATATINVSLATSFTCDYYASPTGASSGTGTITSPWDLHTALSRTTLVRNGKTLCLRGGSYQGKFISSLSGGGIVRSAPGEWAVIDGNARTATTGTVNSAQTSIVLASAANLVPGSKFAIDNEMVFVDSVSGSTANVIRGWDGTAAAAHASNAVVVHAGQQFTVSGDTTTYRDFEITNSSAERDGAGECCGFKAIIRGAGLVQPGRTGNNYINLVIHDNWDGIFMGSSTSNTLIYGCLSYNNGGSNPASGHGLYLENSAGYSRVYETMSFNNFNFGVQAYGVTGAYVGGDFQGLVVAGSGRPVGEFNYNMIYGPDSVASPTGVVNESHFYHPPNTVSYSVKFGYGSGVITGTVTNNYFSGAGTAFEAGNVSNLTFTGNKFSSSGLNDAYALSQRRSYNWNNNTYYNTTSSQGNRFANTSAGEGLTFANWRSTMGFDSSSQAITSDLPETVIVRPNAYSAGRANIIVYSQTGVTSVNVNLSTSGLVNGQSFRIKNAFNYFGQDVLTGTYNSSLPVVSVPLNTAAASVAIPAGMASAPATTCPRFCSLIVIPN